MSKQQILIVEDDRLIAMDIGMQLRKLGYEALGPATTGEDAIAMAEKFRPSLVLMDVHLANAMDGISAAHAIRTRFDLPCLFLSAFSGIDDLERTKSAQPAGYLSKPFEADQLRKAIEAALKEPTLNGQRIRLRPLETGDADALVLAASDGKLWELPFTVVPSADTIHAYIAAALAARDSGSVQPFVTEELSTGQIIGSTRFWKIDRNNRKLEIGSTWLAASWQRTFANTEAKYLMLKYAFDTLGCVRVQFTTDEINEKSRNAILRLGAKQEGIVRNERIMPDGRKRNSVRFSIIDEEWPQVRQALEQRLGFAQGASSNSAAKNPA